jgi:hypothetical protein
MSATDVIGLVIEAIGKMASLLRGLEYHALAAGDHRDRERHLRPVDAGAQEAIEIASGRL